VLYIMLANTEATQQTGSSFSPRYSAFIAINNSRWPKFCLFS